MNFFYILNDYELCITTVASVRNVEAFNYFHTLRSDHRVVTNSIRLRVPKHKKRIKFDWDQFWENTNLQLQYSIAVKNKFQVLEERSNDENYARFVMANNQAMEELVPERGKTKRSSISKHPEIIPIREMVDKAHKEYTESTNNDNKEKWKTAVQVSMIPMKE